MQDYDCFYASVVEAQNPSLRGLPLAVQQKQIIVTCNYAARAQGCYKLQLVREAKQACPSLVIELGEDLTRFRNASKELYLFLMEYSPRAERLGFDEVWLDVTDIVEYNLGLLNQNNLENSFFNLFKGDPSAGFPFDATQLAGHAYGADLRAEQQISGFEDHGLMQRLILGSHMAQHLRHCLEEEKGYTATVGIATSKLLSKLVGNLHKPHAQTTLLPPYTSISGLDNNVNTFIDEHEVGKIPNIGFKTAQKLREYVLSRPAEVQEGLITFNTRDAVKVKQILAMPNMSLQLVDKLVSGPGAVHGLGATIWQLLHGVDESEVKIAREVPTQISMEDSYIRLDTIDEVRKELTILSESLIRRMHVDLLEVETSTADSKTSKKGNTPSIRRWLAQPRSLRLSTRPRLPINSDGSRSRSFQRISRTVPAPTFLFSLTDSVDSVVERLVMETLLPLFRRIHPEKSGWNLSLVNVAVTNMANMAGERKTAGGRNIAKMLQRQESVLAEWKVQDVDVPPDHIIDRETPPTPLKAEPAIHEHEALVTIDTSLDNIGTIDQDGLFMGSEDWLRASQQSDVDNFVRLDDAIHVSNMDNLEETHEECPLCAARLPSFAMHAHLRYHEEED